MGEYFDWVNVNKREYISPSDFDYDNRFHGSLHKNNPVLRALHELLSGRWKGDPVVFLGDEAKIPKDTTYGLLHDLLGQAVTEHYYDFICENYRNVSCLFRDAEKEVREGISNYIYDIKDRGSFEYANEYGIDIRRPFAGLFSLKGRTFPYIINHTKGVYYTVMTLAVGWVFLDAQPNADEWWIRFRLVKEMQRYGKQYPNAGYGGMFRRWLRERDPQPYNSYGNGSAMRVSSTGWLYNDLETVRSMARLSAEVSHNHPEGIKGAEATASAIYLARTGSTKAEIKAYIEENFGYDLSRTCDEIRPDYYHKESCQETVPEAITAFLEGESFEDVIRTAVSLGGDCDTLTCIAGGIAEGFYGVPENLKEECRKRLPKELRVILERFDRSISYNGE